MAKQKKRRQQQAGHGHSANEDAARHAPAQTDARFARLHTDPRFLRPAAHTSKVVLDNRFAHLLKPGSGSSSSSNGTSNKHRVDKFGRKLSQRDEQEDLARFYTLNERDGGGGGGGDEEEEEEESEESDGGAAVDYARGEGLLDSSEEEDSDENDREVRDKDDQDSLSSSDDYDGVLLGRADARRRAKKLAKQQQQQQQQQQRQDGESESDDEGHHDILDTDSEDASRTADAAIAANAKLSKKALRSIDQLSLANQRAQQEAEEEQVNGSSSSSSSRQRPRDADNVPRAGSKILRGDATRRLALVNLDWDHVKAIDLLMIFTSLVSPASTRDAGVALPADVAQGGDSRKDGRASRSSTMPVKGRVLNVRIYPSEFGQERMEKENREGPPREIFKQVSDGPTGSSSKKSRERAEDEDEEDEEDEDDIWNVDEGGEFDEEMLRRYQLQRLRYYYAVATFSSAAVAQHVYDELDGSEMEKTANVFDCRFIPEEMEFPHHQGGVDGWRDEANENTHASLSAYKGVDFTTAALRHSKVKLTWDADDASRSKITRAAQRELSKTELRDEDFKAYLASGSEDEGDSAAPAQEEDAQAKARFRALMGLDQEDAGSARRKGQTHQVFDDYREPDAEQGDMQITFMPGLSEAAARKASGGRKEAEDETTLDKYRRKQKEKKAKKKIGMQEELAEQGEAPEDETITFDDPFFAGGDEDDDFAAALAAEEGRGASSEEKKKRAKSKRAKEAIDEDGEEGQRRKAELQLMVDSESDGGGQGHFDMRDVLRAESGKDKKKRGRRGKRSKDKAGDAAQPRSGKVQKDFDLDVEDARFKNVFEDHRYALDPSHPSFIKTKAMDKLLKERRKRREEGDEAPRLGHSNGSARARDDPPTDVRDLVMGLKRRDRGAGKEQASRKKHKR
ncbi:hypothetical protein IE81DRAFT_368259 [Ceraceosorus guamensis]|uniref:Uncharacterized protein n=1 Tax=Ceraceosorus guamensis TaxID=1522189 RepID=A0A316VVZ3_9BASI|nr:hypothetical protein IE81DRAFT_368259 [Ceraceosorus guamensis]PWN40471.1 hypothetical protein IE81DRAFT_368259 [Ceraceosorus guamensis]